MICDLDERGMPSMHQLKFPKPPMPPPPRQPTVKVMVGGIIDELVSIEYVFVRLHIAPESFVVRRYPNRTLLGDIKAEMARKFEVPEERLVIQQRKQLLYDECCLFETPTNRYGMHELDLVIRRTSQEADAKDVELDINIYNKNQCLQPKISVIVEKEHVDQNGDIDASYVAVNIENKTIEKPFLCGYRNKKTGVEYLNAYSQTGRPFDKWKHRRYRSRDTQTQYFRERLTDTMHDKVVQCYSDGCNVRYLAEPLDYTITPKKYQSADLRCRIRDEIGKVKLLQRNWRRVLITRYMANAAREYRERERDRAERERIFREEVDKFIRKAELAKVYPATYDDVDLLTTDLRAWMAEERRAISHICEKPFLLAEEIMLHKREVELLKEIEWKHTVGAKKLKEKRALAQLVPYGKPVTFVNCDSQTIEVDMLRTQRARFFTEAYHELQKQMPRPERIKFLRNLLKSISNETEFPHCLELYELLEREKNLLVYVHECDISVLRMRQNFFFMELIKFSKGKPVKPKDYYMCSVCNKMKPFKEMDLRSRREARNKCNSCIDMTIIPTRNLYYKEILRQLLLEERKLNCLGGYAFLIQLDDVRHLIENIWHGHSALGQSSDLTILRLPRWIRDEPWSPWNCVCMTAYEARAHAKIENIHDVYPEQLFIEISIRHIWARRAYPKASDISTTFLESREWWHLGMDYKHFCVKAKPKPKPKPKTKTAIKHIKPKMVISLPFIKKLARVSNISNI